MSHARPDARLASADDARAGFNSLYWVIGGRWGDESRSWRRWSEVCGPYLDRGRAAVLREKMLRIHADDPLVHFEVVRREDEP